MEGKPKTKKKRKLFFNPYEKIEGKKIPILQNLLKLGEFPIGSNYQNYISHLIDRSSRFKLQERRGKLSVLSSIPRLIVRFLSSISTWIAVGCTT